MFKCDECNYKSKYEKNVKSHRISKHINKPKCMIQCDNCDYQSRTDHRMKMHIERVHDNIPHPCTICPFIAAKAWILKEHKKLKHEVL